MTKTITPEDAAELYRLAERGAQVGPWTYVRTQRIGARRWNEDYYLVVSATDSEPPEFYGICYSLSTFAVLGGGVTRALTWEYVLVG